MVTFVETNDVLTVDSVDEVVLRELRTRCEKVRNSWDGHERLKRAREAQRQTEYLYRLLFVNVCDKAS